ncbi:UDP-N-acetylmuramoyl-L-alanine--D-glutamate ligase [Candidatus Peregrinibacteria bacterium]|nr:UDP-N-acetylmuramoyl-L-alanine--D-glutamate ligase [Candidatus Peregrinibacteria bacterium]
MKIAIVGYGVEGKALAQYFRKHGHDVTVCDVSEGSKKELEKNKIHTKLGPHYLQNLGGFDLIFRSPGIPYLKKEFDPIRKQLTSATKYFFEKCPCAIVGVTGTKGKGTVSTLLFEILKAAGRKVFLGGNIGKSPMEFLDELAPRDLVILELSSFQLQDLQKSPHVAVVLGITPDHLDHHKDMDEYVDAKRNIVRFQGPKDFAVLDMDNKQSASFEKNTKAKISGVSIEKPVGEGGFLKVGSLILKHGKTGMIFGEKNNVKLLGNHNIKNILAAAAAAHILGAPIEVITKTVREFRGLPHRLEFVKEAGGVKYYNDSASTNPDTAIAALRAFAAPTILIAGGSDKNADFSSMAQEIVERPNIKAVVLMGQTKPKIEHAIETAAAKSPARRSAPLELISADSYQEAFMVARTISSPGDIVLLSPACASFDMFANYKERGDIFRNFVLDMG